MAPSRERGRVVALEDGVAVLASGRGQHRVAVPAGSCALFDVIEVADDGQVRVATPFRGDPGKGATTATRILDPRRQRACAARQRLLQAIRAHLTGHGYLETPTPALVSATAQEPHIKPFAVAGGEFLISSPELAMKRLLVGGLERIFQLAQVFRDEPRSTTHLREFTMLELYAAFCDEHELMREIEALVAQLALDLHGEPRFAFAGRVIDCTPPWPRLPVRALFTSHAGIDPVPGSDLRGACQRLGLGTSPDDSWDDLYFRLWLERVEPRLPADRPCFVTAYPASQAALAALGADADGTPHARRFEVYAAGLELGNAFYELTDPALQAARFAADLASRRAQHPDWPDPPIDAAFLAALGEGMPPAAGIAIGVDRLVMLLADEPDIAYTTWL
jgi:lysyl-tRNA synthetase class 2